MVQAGPVAWTAQARGALLAALSEQEGAALTRYAAAIVGDWATAQDCVQDCLERAHAWLPRLLARGRFKPEAWLYTAVRNRCRDVVRHQRGCRWVREVPLTEGPAVEGEGLSSGPEAAEQRAQVRRVLAALAERDRAALWLCHGQGYPQREIGARLGMSPGATRVFLVGARRRFRQAARELGYAGEWAG